MFRLANDEILDAVTLAEFIEKHRILKDHRYIPLMAAYRTNYPIFTQPPKPEFKPDKRIAVNFAKYIVDTMNGFFIGIPVKVMSNDEAVSDYVQFLDAYNNQDDQNAELSKLCDIYGKAYEMYYVDERGNIGITYLSPEDAFIIYDDSIIKKPRYFVRLYIDADDVLRGSVSDSSTVKYFHVEGALIFEGDEKLHGFDGVPAVEYMENEERMGLFEPVLSMINEYNEAISEKANDVAYFSDAYLKVLGALVDEKSIEQIRANRIINFPGTYESGQLDVDFLQKPDGDTSQEHLLDRLERLIFQISMVADISDENFGSASGIALKYKLQAMSDLALTKQNKFIRGMQNRYRLIFSNPVSGMNKDSWTTITYQFTQNMPANLLEEAQIAAQLTGIVSQPTQLKVLSIVGDIKQEIEQIKQEQDEESYMTDYATNRTVEDVILE
ncbi:MAG: phage portal protein [Anaerovoracaceae bacterium]